MGGHSAATLTMQKIVEIVEEFRAFEQGTLGKSPITATRHGYIVKRALDKMLPADLAASYMSYLAQYGPFKDKGNTSGALQAFSLFWPMSGLSSSPAPRWPRGEVGPPADPVVRPPHEAQPQPASSPSDDSSDSSDSSSSSTSDADPDSDAAPASPATTPAPTSAPAPTPAPTTAAP
eukprot:1269405-Pyramimonas_sp.AAC.1